jgi:DNA polymerase-1
MVVYDIETDGFLDTVSMMSVAWTYDTEINVWTEWDEEHTTDLAHYLNCFPINVGHNISGFDKPVLEKLTGVTLSANQFDTLVACRLRNPDILGGHSLRAWGKRLGVLKGTVTEGDEDNIEEVYGVYDPWLSNYCYDDVKVTIKLLDNLMKKHFDPETIDFNPIDWERWAV